MGVIYQLTFFLALGLLAIVVTIFVFAVSLLGRAIEVARRSEEAKILERKENNAKEMAAIRKDMEEAESKCEIPIGLKSKLDALEKKDGKFRKELEKIIKAPEALTVRGGVFYPCASSIAAMVLSGVAFYLSNVENINWIVPPSFWILGLAAIGYCIYRICKSLNVIQSVAAPAEEVAFKRETEAFKAALKEVELKNVQEAVKAMMVDNNLSTIPCPVTTRTNDMGAFPDTTSSSTVPAGNPGKVADPNGNTYTFPCDKAGYVLYQHDIVADADDTTLVNYVATRYTTKWYSVDSSGTVTQYDTAS